MSSAVTRTADTDAVVRERLLGDEHVALRRVAMFVAEGASDNELFGPVADEAARVLGVSTVMLARYGRDRTITVVASLNEPAFVVGSSWRLDGPSVSATVLDTERPARIDDYSGLPGPIAAGVRDSTLYSTVGAPITVAGAVWGVMTVSTHDREPLPADTEARLSNFAEFVGVALSNAESRAELSKLVDEQVALRRVATLVAARATTTELCAAVVDEVVHVLGVPASWLLRYEPHRSMTVLAVANDSAFTVGSRWPLDGSSVSSTVFATGLPARIDDFKDLPGPI